MKATKLLSAVCLEPEHMRAVAPAQGDSCGLKSEFSVAFSYTDPSPTNSYSENWHCLVLPTKNESS